jgi:hypothetical protein
MKKTECMVKSVRWGTIPRLPRDMKRYVIMFLSRNKYN